MTAPSSQELAARLKAAAEHATNKSTGSLDKAKIKMTEAIVETQKEGKNHFTYDAKLIPLSNPADQQALRLWAANAGVTIARVHDQRDGDYWDVSWR
jgi:hypothetical protein